MSRVNSLAGRPGALVMEAAMKRIAFSLLTLLAAALAPIAAGGVMRVAAAQEPAGLAQARASLPPEAARELERTVSAARARGLPTEPLVSKALEGAAKGVPAERILAVVRLRAEQLGRAQALLQGRAASPADVTAVADALQRGVPESTVKALVSGARPDEPVALAAHTLADLLEAGVPVQAALEVLTAWRSRGANPAELHELPAAVARLVRQGTLPAQAAAAVAAAVRAGRSPASALPPVPLGGTRGELRGGGRQGPPLAPGLLPPAERGRNKGKKPPPT